jgi:thioredoxin-dependent peroxiredoxin
MYFMVSVDTPQDNKAFAEKEHADFPLLSDPTKQTAKAYGLLPPPNPNRPDAPQFARRWTFYIGPDGKILYIDKEVKPQSAGEAVVAKLKELGVKEKR